MAVRLHNQKDGERSGSTLLPSKYSSLHFFLRAPCTNPVLQCDYFFFLPTAPLAEMRAGFPPFFDFFAIISGASASASREPLAVWMVTGPRSILVISFIARSFSLPKALVTPLRLFPALFFTRVFFGSWFSFRSYLPTDAVAVLLIPKASCWGFFPVGWYIFVLVGRFGMRASMVGVVVVVCVCACVCGGGGPLVPDAQSKCHGKHPCKETCRKPVQCAAVRRCWVVHAPCSYEKSRRQGSMRRKYWCSCT